MEQSTLTERLSHLPLEPNPALLEHAKQRAENVQNRIADRITAFAGSMAFVYIHVIWFGCWIGLGVEKYPYGLLTMIVSLDLPLDLRDDQPEPSRRKTAGDRQPAVANGQGGGQAERGAAAALASDPRAHQGCSCLRRCSLQGHVGRRAMPRHCIGMLAPWRPRLMPG
jgi:hypothetical protein